MSDFVTLKDLGIELGMDKSNLRKYVLNEKIKPFNVRTIASRGQATLAITEEEAQKIKHLRQSQGFIGGKGVVNSKNANNGVFYVIQLIPELEPERVKLGFTSNIENRLVSHRVSAPTAALTKTWPCKHSWEEVVIASATRWECELISSEVFLCDSVEGLCTRVDEFFNHMPSCV